MPCPPQTFFTHNIYAEELEPLKAVGKSGEVKFYAQLGGSS